MWRQQVSAKETNRRDVETLRSGAHMEPCCLNIQHFIRSELDKLLGSRQARDSGICQVYCHCPCYEGDGCGQVRRELYAQCQDELIRQTTITCMERGLLLLRLRDESRMTLHAYTVGVVKILQVYGIMV